MALQVIKQSLMQLLKASSPMVFNVEGKLTLFRLLQREKEPFSIVVTPSRIVIEGRAVQPLNAYSPMLASVEGRVTAFKLVQS